MSDPLFEAALEQDEVLRRAGLDIWIGGEPTFTDRTSQESWWLWHSEGGDKETRAVALLRAFVARVAPGAELCRAAGRLYPGETTPRFAFGARWRREEERLAFEPAAGYESPPDVGMAAVEDALLAATPVSPPVIGPEDAWLTTTPDPGVVEVNLAPAPDLATLARYARAVHAAAGDAALSAVRWRYNGQATDSGGGGQLTLGGPSPEQSPFFRAPQLLPRLLRYLSWHPALSYAFAPDCAGSAGQGPRADEGVRERFEELGVALDLLAARGDRATAAEIWSALAPLLVDASGNTHRAEVNVEKLWNPFFGARGKLGVVELRALRMQPDAERMVAVAALFRAVAARCGGAPFEAPLADHGAALHDRLALPAFLQEDLRGVLGDLAAHGFGLPGLFSDLLLAPTPPLASVEMGGATLTLTPAVDFWPLVGDVASQERSGARLVDASSARLQAMVTAPVGEPPGRLSALGWSVPLAPLADGRRHVAAVRYRAFLPRPGLHADLPAHDPVLLVWERSGATVSVALHGWRPQGGAYDGLPQDGAEAEQRRRERVVIRDAQPQEPRAAPVAGLTLDLRRVSGGA